VMYLRDGNIIDIVLAILFLLIVIRGWHVGLVMCVAHIAVLIASAMIASVFVKMTGIIPLYGIVFIIAAAVLGKAVQVLKVVEWIPLIGIVNKAGGAFAGFIGAFLVFYILFGFLFRVVPQEMWERWGLTQEVIDKTYLFKAFIDRG